VRDLRAKTAVVTGAASGIGLALAECFADRGMHVVVADVDVDALGELEQRLAARGTEVLAVRCDVAVVDQVDALAHRTLERFGAAHVVCNNAGVLGRHDAWTGPLDEWRWVLDVNLFGVVHGVRAFLPILESQGEGHIVNTASMAGLTALPGSVPYSVSKHGVVALSEALHVELQMAGSPVGVSCLCPGFVRTELVDRSERTGPSGPAGPPGDGPAAAVHDLMRQGVGEGVDPTTVAEQVVAAIGERRFWILTHESSRGDPVARMRRAARQEDPPVGPESRHPELARLRRLLRQRIADATGRRGSPPAG
jgi:NAD(P)-dependent dehydrogenase (short-subunit alcohol dehydrogenase family)